jgi:hypothetical protein
MVRLNLAAFVAAAFLVTAPVAFAHEHCGGGRQDCHGCPAVGEIRGHACPGCAAGATSPSMAQPGPGARGGGWGPGTAYGRVYDPGTVETLRGEVVGVQRFTPAKGMSAGLHLQVKTAKETLSVHLGPEWYLAQQELEIKINDVIEVKGSRVTFEGEPAIIAAEIRDGDDTLTLRDASGTPAWSGWRRR